MDAIPIEQRRLAHRKQAQIICPNASTDPNTFTGYDP